MPIAIEGQRWHMETHNTATQVVAIGASYSDEITLDRPGDFLGAQCIGNSQSGGLLYVVEVLHGLAAGSGPLIYGDAVEIVRVFGRNIDVGPLTMRFILQVWVKDH